MNTEQMECETGMGERAMGENIHQGAADESNNRVDGGNRDMYELFGVVNHIGIIEHTQP